MKLSVIIPCFNEEATIGEVIQRVRETDILHFEREIIIIDDASQDNSVKVISSFISPATPEVKLLINSQNQGKGAAIRHGFAKASGDILVIQDADLEYDPHDLHHLLSLFENPNISVVFGSRRLLASNAASGFVEYWGAQSINSLTNFLYRTKITDPLTCYKMFRASLLDTIPLRSSGFAIEAELTAKLLRRGHTIREVPITYNPRTRAQGKKIRWRDGLGCLWQIVKCRFVPPSAW